MPYSRANVELGFALVAVPAVLAAAIPCLSLYLAGKAAKAGCVAARRGAARYRAGIDRAFAKECTARLRALRGAAPSVWRRALRELAREREAREDAREALSSRPCAQARRDRARARRDAAWSAWFRTLEKTVAGSGTPPRELVAGNPLRRGPPVRRLCRASVRPAPATDALLAQYERAKGRGRVEEKIRLGSMLLDAEATVDSSLVRNADGEIVGRNAGLRGWIAENCPALSRHYGSLLGYRRLAAEFREAQGLGDPAPAALLVEEDPETERKLPPGIRAALPRLRRRAREWLAAPEAATAKGFRERVEKSWAETRERRRA